MEIINIQRYMHTTPRKLRLVADMVKGSKPEVAMENLRFTNKYAATDLLKAISTALANAKQVGMVDPSFKTIEINEGPRLKRFRAGTRGRAKPYKKRMAHIRIILTDEISAKGKVQSAKSIKIAQSNQETKEIEVNDTPKEIDKKPRKVAQRKEKVNK
jgi:large subunit ribosomal protein L22